MRAEYDVALQIDAHRLETLPEDAEKRIRVAVEHHRLAGERERQACVSGRKQEQTQQRRDAG